MALAGRPPCSVVLREAVRSGEPSVALPLVVLPVTRPCAAVVKTATNPSGPGGPLGFQHRQLGMKATKKQIAEFRKELEKEMCNINAEKGQEWFSEDDIRREAYESPDYVIAQDIECGGTPRASAEMLAWGQ